MSHLLRRARRPWLVGLAAAALAVTLPMAAAAPASAAGWSHRPITYAALGDSYAAGQASDCTHPPTSYPLVLDRLRAIRLVQDLTCAGATSTDVRTGQAPALRHRVRLVTITVGANDVDVAGLVAVCATDPTSSECANAIVLREAELPALGQSLVATFASVGSAAPHARIVVTGYAPLVSSGPILAATDALNATIRGAVLAAAASGVHVRYVGVRFTGHTVDSPQPWFFVSGPNIYHPNAAGERAYARAIARAVLCGY